MRMERGEAVISEALRLVAYQAREWTQPLAQDGDPWFVNADARLILVDGLEQVAEDELDAFIEAATADGWALVASRVTSGPLYIVELDRGPASEQLEARRAALRKTTTTKA